MNIVRFLKDWTLPVSMTVGCLLYAVFAFVPALESAGDFFAPIINTLFPLALFVTLLTTFCKVDFRKMVPTRWQLGVTLMQYGMVGLLLGVILLFDIQGMPRLLLASLLTCVIAPCASAAPTVTNKLGGNLHQMTFYVIVSSLLSAVMIPLVFPLIEPRAGMPFFMAFLSIMKRLCLVLVLPLILGWFIQHYMKGVYSWVKRHSDFPFYTWAFNLSITSGITLRNIFHSDTTVDVLFIVAFTSFLLCLLLFALGWAQGKRLDHRIEAGQAQGQKNTALAIWIASAYLHPVAALGMGFYVLWQNMVNSYELWRHRA
ncbi:MAG: bile acid:sodium symporter [Bacteroidaceae bacterium]|nr:bile acid:sodium symporter [Bacteroidaceae bacterium]